MISVRIIICEAQCFLTRAGIHFVRLESVFALDYPGFYGELEAARIKNYAVCGMVYCEDGSSVSFLY